MDRLLNSQGLAEILGYSPKSIQNMRPEQLPPAVLLPGRVRGRRWRESDVRAWLAELPKAEDVALADRLPIPTRRRGRKRREVW